MNCPICKQPAKSLKSAIVRGEIMTDRCAKCVNNFIPTSAYSAKWKRDRMRESHRADLVQRFEGGKPNPEFARLYPERARQQFGDKFMERI